VGLLFWPRSTYVELLGADRRLRREIAAQLEGLRQGLERGQPRPQPLDAAPLSDAVARMEQLVQRERGGPRQQRLRASGWERRLRHWQLVLFHWLAWERLLATLPPLSGREAPLLERSVEGLLGQLAGQNLPTPARDAGAWRQLALARGLPVLSLLALAEELRPLHTNLGSLGRREPC
jgi:hypothetical protein